ncbi:HD domain-containing phosphohydrolase [Clostridium sp.]|uniref:sensor domain-containing diguanylate cyclase/phosphohydrolase n=1 Tax=Clostridium sp. TaxID=1506 RepID=UPI00284710C8|nr:HD domain-containing phosphohydrolase [Clostridium sp.]MDR3596423.1 PAS domain-containing protein [Clostridium sp.]
MEEKCLGKIYKSFLNNIPWPVWIEGTDTEIIFLNKHYEDMYNIKLKDVIGKKNEEAFPIEKARIYNEQINECVKRNSVYVVEGIVNGVCVECFIFPIAYDDGEIMAVAGIVIDVNDRKLREAEIENQKNILRTIIDAVPEAIFYKDKESRFIGFNKKFEEFYNKRGVTEIIGKTDLEIYDDYNEAKNFIEQDKKIMETKKATYFEHRIENENGREVIEENVKTPVIDKNDEVWGVVGLSRDITDRKIMEERLRYLSEVDILTGLYNRYSFEEKIKELNYEKYLPLGVIMGDVNGLKLVNDTLGHFEGDNLLKSIAKILKEICCYPNGYAFRWGGDEFIILIPNCNEVKCEQIIQDITRKCEQAEYKFMQLSIALGEGIKHSLQEDIYECITKVEEKVYRQKLLEKKSIKSSIMDSLKKSLEEKNMETNEHTERVTKYALAIGRKLKLKISELDELALVASLHDIGKIGVNKEILLKPGKLTKEEFEIMKTHTEKGYRIINASSELGNVAKCVLTHHEKWDGTGYPLGLAKEEIPLMARIINVVDSYDVMTTDRIYKKAIDKEDAIKELKRCCGTQFDPKIVECFIDYIENKKESEI